MLDERKVKLMTKLALYEHTQGKEDFKISEYYRKDYVSYEMIKAFVTSTISFGILFLCWIIYKMDGLTEFLEGKDLPGLGASIAIKYVVFVCIYQIIAFFVYNWRYKKATASVREYYYTLKKVEKLQEKEERL